MFKIFFINVSRLFGMLLCKNDSVHAYKIIGMDGIMEKPLGYKAFYAGRLKIYWLICSYSFTDEMSTRLFTIA